MPQPDGGTEEEVCENHSLIVKMAPKHGEIALSMAEHLRATFI